MSSGTERGADQAQALDDGVRCLRIGSFFKAHDAFEDLWNAAPTQRERELWQGMAQTAAALVKHERGEAATAITLHAKARSRLLAASLPPVAVEALRAYLDALAEAVTGERDLPPAALPAPVLEALRGVLAARTPGAETPDLS